MLLLAVSIKYPYRDFNFFFLILKKEPSDKSSNFLSRLLKILFEVKYLLFL